MSGSRSLGDHGTWQVICLASIGVIYLYTMARWPAENAGGGGEVEGARRLFSRLECNRNRGET